MSERALAAALQLIAHGSADDKVRYVAERDPDWFVDHVLGWGDAPDLDRDATAPAQRVADRRMLDAAIARIAIRDRVDLPLRETA